MSAPTTEEVREALEQAAKAQDAFSPSMPAATAFFAVGAVLEDVALPLAEHRDALAAEVAAVRAERDKVRDVLAHDLVTVVERIGRAVERLGLGDAADCSVDDPDIGYLSAIEDIHDAAVSARSTCATMADEVARLRSVADGARQAWADLGLCCDAAEAEVARLREAAAAVVACVGYDATMQRAVDRLASVLAEAKGAGR